MTLNVESLNQNREGPIQNRVRSDSKKEGLVDTLQPSYEFQILPERKKERVEQRLAFYFFKEKYKKKNNIRYLNIKYCIFYYYFI